MKFKFKSMICAILVVLVSVCFFSCGQSPLTRLEKVWNVKLPKDATVVYQIKNVGWFGDGLRFIFMNMDEEPLELLASHFTIKDSQDLEAKSKFEENILCISLQLDLPDKYSPDLTEEYLWNKTNSDEGLFMLYYTTLKQLYIFEKTI